MNSRRMIGLGTGAALAVGATLVVRAATGSAPASAPASLEEPSPTAIVRPITILPAANITVTPIGGGSPGVTPTPELARLVGTRVRLQSDRVAVGATVCTAPAFEDRRASKEEFSRSFGIQFESIGIKAEQVEAINVRCEGSEWAPPQSLLVKVSEGAMLMLWDGVFLVLKRERHWTGDVLPPLKRRVYE